MSATGSRIFGVAKLVGEADLFGIVPLALEPLHQKRQITLQHTDHKRRCWSASRLSGLGNGRAGDERQPDQQVCKMPQNA